MFAPDDEETRAKTENVINILRQKRWTVVLGDPGSGKTTFARWIVHQLTTSLLSLGVTKVSTYDCDDVSENVFDAASQCSVSPNSWNIGPKRLPIIIRIGEFAEALQKNAELSLFDYLGEHTWMGNSVLHFSESTNEMEKANLIRQLKLAIQDYISKGMAFIILDGLDEIPIKTNRMHIVNLIETFAESYARTPDNRSVFDQQYILDDTIVDQPMISGGNQMVITSRIVGYHVQPLTGEFMHYTIKPLEIDYIIQFVYYWFKQVYLQISEVFALKDEEDLSVIETVCKSNAQILVEQINKKDNLGLNDLASNPSLLDFLCGLSFNTPGARLPSQRICLYDQTATSMVTRWLSTNPTKVYWNKLDSILCDIASFIHEHCASGLIEESDLRRVCTESLKSPYLGKDPNETKIEEQINEYLEIFRINVGILSQRGQHLYGFIHLTFQEYYAAKNMVNRFKLRLKFEKNKKKSYIECLTSIFREHLPNPRYSLILLLALSWINWKDGGSNEFHDLCELLLTTEDEINEHLPLAALLLVDSTLELVYRPSDEIFFKALNQILIASAKYHWHRDYTALEQELAKGINKFDAQFIRKWVLSVLPTVNLFMSSESIFALCHLLIEAGIEIKRISREPIKTSPNNSFEREANNEQHLENAIGWVNSTCYEVLTNYLQMDNEEWEYPVDSILTFIACLNPEVVSLPSGGLRETLLKTPSLVEQCNPVIMIIIIALCGGLHRIQEHNKRSFLPTFLDNSGSKSNNYRIEFSPLYMHRETSLVPIIMAHLKNNNINTLSYKLIDSLKNIQPDDSSLESVDTFIALFCINGTQKLWFYEPYFSFKSYQLATQRFKRILIYLRQFYYMCLDYTDDDILSMLSEASEDDTNQNMDSDSDSVFLTQPNFEKQNVHTDLHQLVTDYVDHLQKVRWKNEELFSFLMAATCARARLCTTARSFLNTHLAYVTNSYQLYLPENFSNNDYLKKLLYNSPDNTLSPDLPYFIRLLWSYRKYKSDEHLLSTKQSDVDLHTKTMFYNHDKDPYYVLSFVSEPLLRLYSCLISSNNIVFRKGGICFKSHQLPFTHLLFECTTSLLRSFYDTNDKCLHYRVRALLPTLDLYNLDGIANCLIWNVCKLIKNESTLTKFLQTVEGIGQKKRTDVADHNKSNKFYYRPQLKTVSHENVKDKLIENVQTMRNQLRDAIECQHKNETINYNIYVSTISLNFLYISLQIRDTKLLTEVVEGVSRIENPLLKLDALTMLAQNSGNDLYSVNGKDIDQELIESIDKVSKFISPVLCTLLILRCLLVLKNATTKQHLVTTILNILESLTDEKQQEAILSALVGLQPSALIPCPVLPFLKRQANLQCLPYFKAHKFLKMCDPNISTYFLSQYTAHESIPVLFYSIYLAELSHEVQLIQQIWGTTKKNNPTEDFYDILTLSKAASIDADLNSDSQCILTLDEDLHRFSRIEPQVESVLQHWLTYSINNRLYTFACHAALLLCENNIWNLNAVNIFCDLLVSENDQFRERAISLAASDLELKNSHRNSSLLSSTALGMEVLEKLMERWFDYRSSSSAGAYFLTKMFNKIIIDNKAHLDKIMDLEFQRIGREIDESIQKQVSFFTILSKVASDVLEHLISSLLNCTQMKGDKISALFAKNFCRIGTSKLFVAMNQEKLEEQGTMLCTALHDIARNMLFDEDIRESALSALAYSQNKRIIEFLWNIITDQTNKFSERLIVTALRSYFHRVLPEQNDVIYLSSELLQRPSTTIVNAVSDEIGLGYQNLHDLLYFFNYDYKKCYDSLRYGTSNELKSKNCAMTLVQLIENYPILLQIFLMDLLESIQQFTTKTEKNDGSFMPFEQNNLLETTDLLIQKMPAAVEVELNRSGIADKLKKALYYTSKQHNHSRRIYCLRITSFFKELTLELCEMIMEAQVDTSELRKAADECISLIYKASSLAVKHLIVNLKSKSLMKCHTAATILVRLVHAQVVSAHQVQREFIDFIKHNHRVGSHASMFNQIMYELLLKMTHPIPITRTSEEGNDNQEKKFSNKTPQTWLTQDFNAAEKAAHSALCFVTVIRDKQTDSPKSIFEDNIKSDTPDKQQLYNDAIQANSDQDIIENDTSPERRDGYSRFYQQSYSERATNASLIEIANNKQMDSGQEDHGTDASNSLRRQKDVSYILDINNEHVDTMTASAADDSTIYKANVPTVNHNHCFLCTTSNTTKICIIL